MSELDELRDRVDKLERRVTTEAQARASQDQDQSTLELRLRSMDSLLQALALNGNDQTRLLSALQRQTTRLEERQDVIETGVQTIIGLLERALGHGDVDHG